MMGNRGHKRADKTVELPADKRACSSLEFSRPSSSNSSIQTNLSSRDSTSETHSAEGQNANMDTSTDGSDSGSQSEEGEPDRDSTYGSCSSDDDVGPRHASLRAYQRQRSSGDNSRLRNVLSNLSENVDSSGQLAALTDLCEVLSFCSEGSISSMMADSLSPVLVKLAGHESNPDIMLLAIRAITYLCDVYPRATTFLVRHKAVPTLCQRLMAIEYLDVAEQCFQALEKISRTQPLPCLQAGAIMAVLSFIDFFSTTVQRVALSTVINICKQLPSECPSHFMEAVPILCNLLNYEDRQLVENVAVCLIKISERACQSSEMMNQLCNHGLINQATRLVDPNSRAALSQPIYNGLIGLLAKLSACSIQAFKMLYELNISNVLKDILVTYDHSHVMSSPHVIDGQGSQVHEVLKLLHELLPNVSKDQDAQEVLDRKSFLVDHQGYLIKFGFDVLPTLIQVVNSGANLYVCCGCLSVVNKFVYLCKSDMLVELFKTLNIPSFLAGVLTRKEHHVLLVALQIAETILQKLSDVYLNSFIKEGVLFAIDALLEPEKCPQLMFPMSSGLLPNDSNQKCVSRVTLRCLCYAFSAGTCPPASETGKCMLERDGVQNLVKHIRTSYFAKELGSEKGVTDILQKLQAFSSELNDLVNAYKDESPDSAEEKFYSILHRIMANLNGGEPVSTFEFIESGIVKSLVNYLSNGLYLREKMGSDAPTYTECILEQRFRVLTRVLLLSSDLTGELPISILVRKLLSALSSLESFPVILSHESKIRPSFAAVPHGRCISHPCLRVRFVRGEGETCLSDYTGGCVTVDPLSTINAMEGFLLPKVERKGTEPLDPMESENVRVSSNVQCSQGESSSSMEPTISSADMLEAQENQFNTSQPLPDQTRNLGHTSPSVARTLTNASVADTAQDVKFISEEEICQGSSFPTSCSSADATTKLVFYLEGKLLDGSLTLYQVILQHKIKGEEEINFGAKLWAQVYTLTYRLAVGPTDDHSDEPNHSVQKFDTRGYMRLTPPFSNIFKSQLVSDLDESKPTYDILFLLRGLECLNRSSFHIKSCEKMRAFVKERTDSLEKVVVPSLAVNELVSKKLTEKLEQQLRDSFAISTGGIPLWCNQIIASCPFLFSFEARCKYFRLSAFGHQQVAQESSHGNASTASTSRDRQSNSSSSARKKFLVCRDKVLESAAQMMDVCTHAKVPIDVVYNEEVGTGLGPTLEFYTLVSNEFQKSGLGMWRGGHFCSFTAEDCMQAEHSGTVMSPLGLFPRPWAPTSLASSGIEFSEVTKNFVLLGQIVAKALQDGRILDLPFAKPFYKLILKQELNICDISSFDPELGRALLEFKVITHRKKFSGAACGANSWSSPGACFHSTPIEDLCLEFSLPGYPDYILAPRLDDKLVNIDNLEEYVSMVVDATVGTGISRQVEAFKSGFNQIFPIEHLQIFTEEELERLLCGEQESWAGNELLDHIKFDHGYTASSPPILHLLEIMQEFNCEQKQAFLKFVTGAPRLPPGGLASLNPKLTIVRKCSDYADADLPSVMTCANYLKLPPYSSKEKMKAKILYAITEGQGSFHLS